MLVLKVVEEERKKKTEGCSMAPLSFQLVEAEKSMICCSWSESELVFFLSMSKKWD